MRGLVAEMYAETFAHALRLFDGRVDRTLIYLLLVRRTLDGGLPTPVLALSDSLGIPFETTRRHVGALGAAGLCRRVRGGIVATEAFHAPPMATVTQVMHDSMVRFVARMAAVDALPPHPAPTRDYDWRHGLYLSIDLLLSLAHTAGALYNDRLDLVLYVTVMAANMRQLNADPCLGRRFGDLATPPPPGLIGPLRIRRLAEVLGLPEATVRRRVGGLSRSVLTCGAHGVAVDERWIASAAMIEVGEATGNGVRRMIGALASHGFPFHDITAAYRIGPPAPLEFA